MCTLATYGVFRRWRGADPLPAAAETVAAFLASEADRPPRQASTIGRRVAAIRYAHKLAGLPIPSDDERVRATIKTGRKPHGVSVAQAAPFF